MLDRLKRFLRSQQREVRQRPARRRLYLSRETLVGPIYAISDVHGCYDLLMEAEAKIRMDIERHNSPGTLIMLGDYIDRGPRSAEVLDHLRRDTRNSHFTRLTLCGNHEEMMLDAVSDSVSWERWVASGGDATLVSYRGASGQRRLDERLQGNALLPPEHIDYISGLPVSAHVGDFLFVHAGILPGVPLEAQRDSDMLWIREPFLTRGPQLGLTVIHGHTPNTTPDIGNDRVGIDTGCWATGKLCVLKLVDGTISFL